LGEIERMQENLDLIVTATAATVGVGTATVQGVRAEMRPFESEAAA